MKTAKFFLIQIIIVIIILGSCEDENINPDSASYKGYYCGFMILENTHIGVWSCTVNADDSIFLTLHDGLPVEVSGIISSNGTFKDLQTKYNETLDIEGKIDIKGNVNGRWREFENLFGNIVGSEGLGETNYGGSWYENSSGIYFKLEISDEEYALYSYHEEEQAYGTEPIDDGTYNIENNDIYLYPSNGINEHGKIYMSDDTLVIALDGLSPMVYYRTDPDI